MPSESSTQRQIAIAGGCYIELCQWPPRSELMGSGVRAACAIARRAANVALHTYISSDYRPALESISAAVSCEINAYETPGLYEFHYAHSLADPRCVRPSDSPKHPIVVEAPLVLAYGMMEGNPIIHGEGVVYDPQSPRSPKNFRDNTSSARRLSIITNEKEAIALSGLTELGAAGARIRENQSAEVVVIKRGLKGSIVFSETGTTVVPAYRTPRAFLIGSGDIFSAEFAYRWLIENASAEEAARLASLAVAYYSQNPSLPVPTVFPSSFEITAIPIDENKTRSVYLAGPFFNPQQLWMIEETLTQLRSQGLKVFSPFHDVGFGPAASVAKQDLKAISTSDSLFALLDDYDPGTLFEIGFARAINKPVTVFISSRNATLLTMLVGSDCDVFHDFVSAICWEASR